MFKLQGKNCNHVMVKYMSSFFIEATSDELDILARLFDLESTSSDGGDTGRNNGYVDAARMLMEVDDDSVGEMGADVDGFNCLVDLCGIFKKTSVYEVKTLLLKAFGLSRCVSTYSLSSVSRLFLRPKS